MPCKKRSGFANDRRAYNYFYKLPSFPYNPCPQIQIEDIATLNGNQWTINKDVIILACQILTFPSTYSINLGENINLTNYGKIVNESNVDDGFYITLNQVNNYGVIINNGIMNIINSVFNNYGTIVNKSGKVVNSEFSTNTSPIKKVMINYANSKIENYGTYTIAGDVDFYGIVNNYSNSYLYLNYINNTIATIYSTGIINNYSTIGAENTILNNGRINQFGNTSIFIFSGDLFTSNGTIITEGTIQFWGNAEFNGLLQLQNGGTFIIETDINVSSTNMIINTLSSTIINNSILDANIVYNNNGATIENNGTANITDLENANGSGGCGIGYLTGTVPLTPSGTNCSP